tara:strand:+ start:192 stop:323 length:132 start_codon:yes stop_codon:yes gene_type:complete
MFFPSIEGMLRIAPGFPPREGGRTILQGGELVGATRHYAEHFP